VMTKARIPLSLWNVEELLRWREMSH